MGLFSRSQKQKSPTSRAGDSMAAIPLDNGTATSHPYPFGNDGKSGNLDSFPGPESISEHFLSLLKTTGTASAIAGSVIPQKVLDEAARIVPELLKSAIHPAGMGIISGDPTLSWCVITDGEFSMALFPGSLDLPEHLLSVQSTEGSISDRLRQCAPQFHYLELNNGEGGTHEVAWVERAEFVPLQWLAPWREMLTRVDPSSASPSHQEIMGAIATTLTPIYESDSSEELKPWIPKIIQLCKQITQEEPLLLKFVTDMHDMSVRASLADWAASQGATSLHEQGWSQLKDSLQAAFPGIDLALDSE